MTTTRGRSRLAITLIAGCLAVLSLHTDRPLAQQRGGTAATPPRPPNVLFVVFDDLNDWTGPTKGHPQASTPAFDSIARRGANFTSAHVQAPLCNPSRASFLSGLRPSTTGIYALQPSVRTALANYPDLRDHVTLPGYFTERGYQTATVGKIFHVLEPQFREREFQKWIEAAPGARPKARVAGGVLPPETPASLATVMDWGPFPERDEDHGDYKVADAAIEQIRGMSRDQPFFLAVRFPPAARARASRRRSGSICIPTGTVDTAAGASDDDRDDTPRVLLVPALEPARAAAVLVRRSTMKRSRSCGPTSRARASWTRSSAGCWLRSPTPASTKNTIVVALGDHGWHLGEKEISGKNTLWERSTHVPLVFAGPGVAAARRRTIRSSCSTSTRRWSS